MRKTLHNDDMTLLLGRPGMKDREEIVELDGKRLGYVWDRRFDWWRLWMVR